MFTAEQKSQLETPTYRARNEKEHSKTVNASPSTATPILVYPKDCKLTGKVDGGRILEETPTGKKKKLPEESPKASKLISDDLKTLDDKWSQRFAHLQEMVLAKAFAVSVELVQKTGSEVVTSESHF